MKIADININQNRKELESQLIPLFQSGYVQGETAPCLMPLNYRVLLRIDLMYNSLRSLMATKHTKETDYGVITKHRQNLG